MTQPVRILSLSLMLLFVALGGSRGVFKGIESRAAVSGLPVSNRPTAPTVPTNPPPPVGKGMIARFNLKDRSRLPNINQTDYLLVRKSPYVLGAMFWFTWAELEPQEGTSNFTIIDQLTPPWIAEGKRFAIGVMTSPDGAPDWVYQAGAARVTGEPPANRVYPVYWDPVYQQKFGNLLKALAGRYGNDPNLELLVMGGFGEGITEHPVDNDSGTEATYTNPQWEAAGSCRDLTAEECRNWIRQPNGPYVRAIKDIRRLWRTAFPVQQLVTRVHELGEPTPTPFEAALRADSLANGYGLTNDGASSRVRSDSRTALLGLSQAVKVGWISWVGRDKMPREAPVLGQVPGGTLGARTYYVSYTWVIAGVGESTPAPSASQITAGAGNLLKVTVPPFETEVTSANIYVGTSRESLKLQGSVTQDGGAWTEPASGISTTGPAPPTQNTAFGSVLDLYQHVMGIDGHPKLAPSGHVSYLFRDIDTLIRSVPGTSTYITGDPEKYEAGLIWAHNNYWPLSAAVTSVSAASFSGASLAAEAIVAAFGSGLATGTTVAIASPLPTMLAGTTVKVRDNAGVERLAPLFFVAPTQVNYQIPPGTANGAATVTITSGDGKVSAGTTRIASVAPGLFTADASGRGLAAAVALRIKADGSQQFEPVARFDPAQNKFVAVPIDLGPESDQVFLILFGTGLRFRSALNGVSARIGGADSQVTFAGAQGGFAGLDQVNLRLSRSLIGRGELDVALTVDGQTANTVTLSIR
ncbi:MAG: beta-galactosidase [Blastocatellia bacterium]